VHRLDKDTSGLMVVAKTLEAQTDLVRQLAGAHGRRQYLALASGSMKRRRGRFADRPPSVAAHQDGSRARKSRRQASIDLVPHA
jgi:23S rRNA-/tRNA-specific pseudouridylate synthase